MSKQPRREYTAEERAAAKADLVEKVRGLMTDMAVMAMERIDKLDASGADVVGDHLDNGSNFVTPKDFMVALCREGMHQYGRAFPNRATNKIVENYYALM